MKAKTKTVRVRVSVGLAYESNMDADIPQAEYDANLKASWERILGQIHSDGLVNLCVERVPEKRDSGARAHVRRLERLVAKQAHVRRPKGKGI